MSADQGRQFQPTPLSCECEWHIVLCFHHDCPRARRIREERQRAYEAARQFCGDPMGCVEGRALTDIEIVERMIGGTLNV